MARYVAEPFDINRLYQELYGYVAPEIPNELRSIFSGGVMDDYFSQYRKKTVFGTEMIMPVTLSDGKGTSWDIPTEPMVSIKGGQKIIRRYPNRSKKGGSIKERWSSDDYRIEIKGVLVDLENGEYPERQVRRIRNYCEQRNSVGVTSPLFRVFGIERMVIEKFEVPFSTGISVQSYVIVGYSDQMFDSLLVQSR